MGEYYIRAAEGGDVRGPFDEEQLTSLAEAGKITLETQLADETKENWVVVGENAEVKAMLFPEKKKLGLKKGGGTEAVTMINRPEDAGQPEVTVEQMLAAGEGHTEDTKYLKERQQKMDKAAGLAMPVLAAMMLLSGLANSLPRYPVLLDLFSKGDWHGLLHEPFAVIGLFDFLIAGGLFLNVFSLFPLVRFRAMIGMGYFLFYYWSHGDTVGMAASVGAGLGLFICTLTLNLGLMILFALVGVGSMGYLAWAAWTALSVAG
ncbi:MAG TPA: GYF domain-containing protein [Opitutales bacterium]|nr:GYF domain-containing protein [Opitutales bacterium]